VAIVSMFSALIPRAVPVADPIPLRRIPPACHGGAIRRVRTEWGAPSVYETQVGCRRTRAFLGLVVLFNAARMWVWLRRHPWRPWPSRFRVVPGFGNGSPTLVLTREEDGREFVLSVVGVKWRWGALTDCDRGEVWLAGDPARGGVIAPPSELSRSRLRVGLWSLPPA
jgi:hypothetical protein